MAKLLEVGRQLNQVSPDDVEQWVDVPETANADFLQKAPKTVQVDSKVYLVAGLVAVVR